MTSLVESLIRMAYVPEGRFVRVKVNSVPDWPAVGQLASELRRPTTKHRASVGSLTGKVGNHLQVIGVKAGHESDGDRPRGATPLHGKRRVLLDLVVGVEKDGLRDDGGRESDNGSKAELHGELNRDECSE